MAQDPFPRRALEDGIVRVYLLPGSDRIVNLERIADASPTPLEVRAALLGRWQAQGMPLRLEFHADGTVVGGEEGAGEGKRWEVLDVGRIRIDGEDQRVEVDGDELSLATRGPTLRFRRVRN